MPGPANLPDWLTVGSEVRFMRLHLPFNSNQSRGMVTGVHLRDDGLHIELTPYEPGNILKGWFPIDWAVTHCRAVEPPEEDPTTEPMNVDNIDTLGPLVSIIGEPFGPLPDWFQIGATFAWNGQPYVIEEMWHPLPEMEPLLRIRNLNTEEMSVEGGEILREEGADLWNRYPPEQLDREPILGRVAIELVLQIREEYERTQEMIRSMGARILQAVREGRRPPAPEPEPPAPEEPRPRGPSVWRRLLEKSEPDAGAGGAASPHRAHGDTTPSGDPRLE